MRTPIQGGTEGTLLRADTGRSAQPRPSGGRHVDLSIGHEAQQVTDDSFDSNFERLWVRACSVAYRLLGSRSTAEEVAQECMVRAYSHWRRISHRAEAWVCRVAYNLAIDEIRRTERAQRLTPLPPHAPDPRIEDRLDLVAVLRRLPRRQREVLVLRYLADQSQTATAAALGINETTVARAAGAGLAALRERLEERTAA